MPRRRGRSGRGNRTDEPIASAMCGFNEAWVLRIVAECFPKLTYNDLQGAVVDESAWPDSLNEFLFCHEKAGALKKIDEQREYLGPDAYRRRAFPQTLIGQIQAKGIEDNTFFVP
jgi:hypothetical protein